MILDILLGPIVVIPAFLALLVWACGVVFVWADATADLKREMKYHKEKLVQGKYYYYPEIYKKDEALRDIADARRRQVTALRWPLIAIESHRRDVRDADRLVDEARRERIAREDKAAVEAYEREFKGR